MQFSSGSERQMLRRETNSAPDPAVRLLVVDDDREIRSLLSQSLRMHGFLVEVASNVQEMERVLADHSIDLIILDVMMPGEDGITACRRITQHSLRPVVFLSARSEEAERIVGLEVGAGHYLTKPCSPREVLATVRAALRARDAVELTKRNVYGFCGWQMDVDAHELLDPNGVLALLTDGEFALLRTLVERPRRVLSRDMLLSAARGPNSDAYDRAIDVQISRLRRKIKCNGDDIIKTVRNEGYMFAPNITRL